MFGSTEFLPEFFDFLVGVIRADFSSGFEVAQEGNLLGKFLKVGIEG